LARQLHLLIAQGNRRVESQSDFNAVLVHRYYTRWVEKREAVTIDEWGTSRIESLGWTSDIWKAIAVVVVIALIVVSQIARAV
jgi:hypothetical protein